MGWLSNHNWDTKQSLVEHIMKDFSFIDHSVKGNTLYGLYKFSPEFGEGFGIIVCLMQKFNSRGQPAEWGYKNISEGNGPCIYDCPERILSRSTVTDGYAEAWRQRCRAKRKAKAKVFEPVDGSRVRFEAESLPDDLAECREWTLRYNTSARLLGKRPYWTITNGAKTWKITKTTLASFSPILI